MPFLLHRLHHRQPLRGTQMFSQPQFFSNHVIEKRVRRKWERGFDGRGTKNSRRRGCWGMGCIRIGARYGFWTIKLRTRDYSGKEEISALDIFA
jgi:hypothetical protein